MIFKPRQHIDGVFCGDGGHKVEEDHAEQGEDQVQFPPNPKKVLVWGQLFSIHHESGIVSPISQWS